MKENMDKRRTRFESAVDKRRALRDEESAGKVADSRAVRRALVERVHSGEITLVQAQAELRKIQASAKSASLMTRAQAFGQG